MNDAVRRSRGNAQPTDSGMIMLIRHAEKPLHPSHSPHGVNPDGQEDAHSLTVTGWMRAGALVELFAPSRGDSPAELRRPDTIYASAYAGGHSKRSMQTVSPGPNLIRGLTGHREGSQSSKPTRAMTA